MIDEMQISSLFNLKPKENSGRSLEDESDASSWNPARLITESKNERVSPKAKKRRDRKLGDIGRNFLCRFKIYWNKLETRI